MGDILRFDLLRVVGTARVEHLLCTRIALPRPAPFIREVRKDVFVDQVDATLNNVIVTGRLRLDWLYPLADDRGRLFSTTTETPFCLALPVAGAAPGDEARVTEADVTGGATTTLLTDEQGNILELQEASVVALEVQVLRPEEVSSPPPVPPPAPRPPAKRQKPSAVLSRFLSAPRSRD
ncbi:MAG TPA: DUF3794 domain-containing protein [Symbiobacteriaceae bacterium]|nr:DUF3794 domain-containing protein [Symbiobacteriaceae bacterium]